MCWKHEWAKAINNLEWAKIHLKRAGMKVKKRDLVIAYDITEELIETLEEAQEQLKILIQDFGISMKASPSSLVKHIQGSRVKSGKVEAWVENY